MGVCCGNKAAMNRSDPAKAARVAYVIGTFAGHPAVMGSMNAFLKCTPPQCSPPRLLGGGAAVTLRAAARGRPP